MITAKIRTMGGHAPVLVCGNLYVVLPILTSVLGKGVCTQQYRVGYSLSLLLYNLGAMCMPYQQT